MKRRAILQGPQVALVTSSQQLHAALVRIGSEFTATWLDTKGAAGVTWTLEGGVCIVGLNFEELPDGKSAMATLAHEATHVKQSYMRHIGEREPSDEFEAYAVETIMANLMDQYEVLMRKRMSKGPAEARKGPRRPSNRSGEGVGAGSPENAL